MKKTIRKLMNKNHQLYLAHGLQLAAIKVLYNVNAINEQYENQCDANLLLTTDSDNSDMKNEDSVQNYETFEVNQEENLFSTELVLQNSELYSLITKIRKVVRLFKKSSTKKR